MWTENAVNNVIPKSIFSKVMQFVRASQIDVAKTMEQYQVAEPTQNRKQQVLFNTVEDVVLLDEQYAISPIEQAKYDAAFETIAGHEPYMTGFVFKQYSKTIATNFPAMWLAKAWSLADATSDGKLDKHEFAVVCHLIHLKQMYPTMILPTVLPETMKTFFDHAIDDGKLQDKDLFQHDTEIALLEPKLDVSARNIQWLESQNAQSNSQVSVSNWKELDYNDLQFEPNDILGQGQFGIVKPATWKGLPVAVKDLLDPFAIIEVTDQWIKQQYTIVSSLHYHQLVSVLGAVTVKPHYCLVMEYMNQGSLYHYLHVKQQKLSLLEMKHLVVEMVEGLQYMHANNILHCNLKPSKVLLYGRNELHAKISAFGFAKAFVNTASQEQFLELETMQDESFYSFGIDIWSMGMIMYEMLTNRVPYANEPWISHIHHRTQTQLYQQVALSKQLPAWPAGINEKWKVIVQACWDFDHKKRPACLQLLKQVKML